MPPPTVQDPFGGQGPFDKYLDPVQAAEENRPKWDSGQKFNGYEGAFGKTLGVFSKFAEGLSKGRVIAFARKEQEKNEQLNVLGRYVQSELSNPNTTEARKQQLQNKLKQMWGAQQLESLKDKGSEGGKDKDTLAGHAHGIFSKIFGVMAGPNPKTAGPTAANIIDFLKQDTTEQGGGAGSGGVQAESAKLRQDFAGILPKIQADAKAKDNFNVLTREQILQHPETGNYLARARQISPQTAEDFLGQINTYPSGDNPQQRQRLEYGYGLEHPDTITPPPTRAEPWMADKPQGYLEGQMQAQPPATRGESVVRQPQAEESTLAPLSRSYQGPPVIDPHFEAKQDLRAIASGYHTEKTATARNPYTGEIETNVTQLQLKEWDAELGRRQKTEQEQNKQAQIKVENARKRTQFDANEAWRKDQLGLGEKRIENGRSANAIAWANNRLRSLENDEKQAPEAAFSKLVQYAAQKGIQPSKFVDQIDDVADYFEDPDITKHRGYIIEKVAKIKKAGKTDDWSMFLPGAAAAAAAKVPPPTRTAAPISGATSRLEALDGTGKK